MVQKVFTKFVWDHPSTGAPNAGGVGKNCVLQPVEKCAAHTRQSRKFVSIRHRGQRPRRCAGAVVRGVINNTGGSRPWLIIVTVQLTSTRLVVRKSIDDTHGIACSLCDSCA